jgi:glycosyltransferase involved in cell wall biosynthesis
LAEKGSGKSRNLAAMISTRSNGRMRVVFAHHEPIDRGRARWVAIVRSVAAVAERVDVTWFTPDVQAVIHDYTREQLGLKLPAGLRIETLPSVHKRMGLTLNGVFFRRFVKALNAGKADVLWLRSDKLAAHVAHRHVRVPLVYEAHLIGELWARDRGDSERKAVRQLQLENDIYAHAAGVAAITQGLLNEVRARYGYSGPAAVVPSAVDTSLFKRVWQGDGRTVVWVGTLQFWKGLTLLLEAIAASPGLRLKVVGGGKPENERKLRDEITRLRIADRVELTGPVPQTRVPELVRNAACAVHPLPPEHSISARFTSPLKLYEYLAMGLPIVAADVPSVREVLTDGKNARLYEAGSAGALAQALREVAGNRVLAERLSCKDASAFSYSARAQKLVALFTASTAMTNDQ